MIHDTGYVAGNNFFECPVGTITWIFSTDGSIWSVLSTSSNVILTKIVEKKVTVAEEVIILASYENRRCRAYTNSGGNTRLILIQTS